MAKKTVLLLAISYTLILVFFSLATINSMPKLGTNYDDKIFHMAAYALLVLLWNVALRNSKIVKTIFLVAIASIVFGIIIEVLQEQLTTVRVFDLLDILANSIGVAIATLLIIIKKRTIVKNS